MNILPVILLAALAFLAAPAHATEAPAATPLPETAEGDAAPAVTEEAPPSIYMVTRIKLTGTDFTQVVFFRHPAITTLEACEAERQAGLSTGWNYFSRYYLKTLKGISYKVEYRCVESRQDFVNWRQGVPLDNFYLVHTTDRRLEVRPQRNFFACRHALRDRGTEESLDRFCAISSQALMQQPAAVDSAAE